MKRDYEKEREYLSKLVESINKDVHKKYRKYSRNKWISDYDLKKLDIKFDSLERDCWIGGYRPSTDEIIISESLLEGNTLNPTNRCSKEQKRLNKKVKDTLIHELCHYWCDCYLDNYDGICYTGDDSPLFIVLNYYINPDEYNSYASFKDVKHTKFKERIDGIPDLEELEIYLIHIANLINKMIRKYPFIKFEWEDEHVYAMYNYYKYMYEDEEPKFLSAYRYKTNVTDLVCESLEEFNKEEASEDEREIIEKRIKQYKNGEKREYSHTIVLPRELYDLDKIRKEVDFLAKEIENELKK